MEKLSARAVISDLMLHHARQKVEVDRHIKHQLSRSLSEEIVKKDIDRIIMKREFNSEFPYPWQRPGETVYELDCYVLTVDEYKEYEKLKKFKHLLQGLLN